MSKKPIIALALLVVAAGAGWYWKRTKTKNDNRINVAGKYAHPVNTDATLRITGVFSEPREDHKHLGTDFAVVPDTPIVAFASGKVVQVALQENGAGLHVVVEHPQFFADGATGWTKYFHLNRADVEIGQVVAVGDQLGLSGGDKKALLSDSDPTNDKNAGTSSGGHLHFEVARARYGGQIDPEKVLLSAGIDPQNPRQVVIPAPDAEQGVA